ncbi:unnamed protein product [Oreochromis niloticus]|nr:unnamed protein product [Mustela putorius furo]
MLKLIMVLLWMILLVVLLCAEAENVTEVRGELGTNVTLTCSDQTAEIHWYMEIHSQFRAGISCSFSTADSTYCSPGFKSKFSILGNKLVIKNLRAEDCRLYFCGIKRDGSIHFVETLHLFSDVTQPTNNPQNNCFFSLLITISVSVVAFSVLIITFACIMLCLKRKSYSNQRDDISIHIYDVPEPLQAVKGRAVHSQPRRHH